MDAGIGAPRRVQRIVRADDLVDLVFEDLLDADRVGLPLPAGVVGAVVRDRQLERARHRKPLGP
jgi:hypothetical protein